MKMKSMAIMICAMSLGALMIAEADEDPKNRNDLWSYKSDADTPAWICEGPGSGTGEQFLRWAQAV